MSAFTLPICEADERRGLGAILDGNAAAYDIAAQSGLTSADFSLHSHRMIYAAVSDLAEAGECTDLSTVAAKLQERGQLSAIGGEAYLADLIYGAVFEVKSFRACIKRLRDSADRRALIAACHATASHAAETGVHVSECLELLDDRLLPIQVGSAETPTERIASPDDLPEWVRLSETGQTVVGLTTGLSCLDSTTTGIRPGEFWIVGGRTGDGKTSLALQAAAANCREDSPVMIFSLEMSRKELVHRLWAQESLVPFWKIRNPAQITKEEHERIRRAAEEIATWPLWVNESGSLTISKLCSLARIAIRQRQIRLICVDYVQLLSCPAREERERVTRISNALRTLAKTTGVPVLAISQLSRPRDGNQNARPNRFALKESGSLENDAHVIVLTYRPTNNYDQPTGEDELIIAKQRHGPVGMERVYFKPEFLRFYERTRN